MAHAQANLVPNPSFEAFTACPSNSSQLLNALPWYGEPVNSSDYYNTCGSNGYGIPINISGNEQAKNGNAYSGIYLYINAFPNAREYIEAQLIDTLENGKKMSQKILKTLLLDGSILIWMAILLI